MKMRKLLAILMALALVMSFSVGALAATVTISPVDETGADFNFYKLISITPVPATATTPGYDKYEFVNDDVKAAFVDAINLYENDTVVATTDSDSKILMYITNNLKTDSTFAADLAASLLDVDGNILTALNLMASIPSSSSYVDTTQTMTYTLDGNGYYLILDISNYGEATVGEQNPMIAVVIDSQPIKLKTTTYTEPKKVEDLADDSIAIGDVINYTVTLNVPNYIQYKYFDFKLVDTMGQGLTFEDDVSVTLNGAVFADFDDDYEIELDVDGDQTGRTKITIDFGDIIDLPIGGVLVVSYSATVNEDALVVDGELNNDVYVVENNIYVDGTGTKSYTYGFVIEQKVNEYGETLPGVGFTLYDSSVTDANGDPTGTPYYFNADANGVYILSNASATGAVTEMLTAADGSLKAFGLAKGTYYLFETKPLDGYNSLSGPKTITINDSTSVNFVIDSIVNVTGITIPGTGGIGTTLFTIFGGVIILGAFTLLVANRKRIFGK